jgi:predicted transcriptional regulator
MEKKYQATTERERLILMSIMTKYAKEIFDGTKPFEFRKSPLKQQDLKKKVFCYSAKEDKAIIGTFEIPKIIQGSTSQLLKATGYDNREDGQDVINYLGKDNKNAYALQIENPHEYTEYLTLQQLRRANPKVSMPQYFQHVYENDPIYNPIVQHDKKYGYDGNSGLYLPNEQIKDK